MLSSYNIRVSMQSDADLAGLIDAGRLVEVTDCPKGLKGLTYGLRETVPEVLDHRSLRVAGRVIQAQVYALQIGRAHV